MDRRAVGVGDDPAISVLVQGVQVDLGDDERDIVLVAKLGSIVDDDATGSRGLGCEFARHLATGREQAELRFAEIETRQIEHRQTAALEADRAAERAVAGEGIDFPDGELTLREDLEQRFTHQAGGALRHGRSGFQNRDALETRESLEVRAMLFGKGPVRSRGILEQDRNARRRRNVHLASDLAHSQNHCADPGDLLLGPLIRRELAL